MGTLLEISPEEMAARFRDIKTRYDLERLLDIERKSLNYYLYICPVDRRYSEFTIPKKSGGKRRILVPRTHLKIVQQKLNQVLQAVYPKRVCVHSFVPEKSIVSGAKGHVGRRYVLNVDLRDFFPSINFGRVRGMFMSSHFGFSAGVATILAQICCHDNQLPQGAPTSPIVSNMICVRMDNDLMRLAGSCHCFYSRYADDITFSKASGSFPIELATVDDDGVVTVGQQLAEVIRKNGFSINTDKVSLKNNRRRQSVTGLTVNRKVNVPRSRVREIRAMLHAWQKYGIEAAAATHAEQHYRRPLKRGHVPAFDLIVRGKIEYIGMVKGRQDPAYKNLQNQLAKLDPSYLDLMLKRNRSLAMKDVFISHASEDKDDVARPLACELTRRGYSVWFDEYELKWGDSLRAKIDEGLSASRFGIVIFSPSFFGKKWPQDELDGLYAREATGQKVILPVWHNVSQTDVAKYSPILASRLALETKKLTISEIADQFSHDIAPAP